MCGEQLCRFIRMSPGMASARIRRSWPDQTALMSLNLVPLCLSLKREKFKNNIIMVFIPPKTWTPQAEITIGWGSSNTRILFRVFSNYGLK